jgi:hypothetical protein
MDIGLASRRYVEYESAYKEVYEHIEDTNVQLKYPIVNQVLSDISHRVDSLFKSILVLAVNDDLYALYILYRSTLEHFYRGFYIFAKTIKDLNEDVAESYQKHLCISEFLAEKSGQLEMEDLINQSKSKTDFISFLGEKHPELKEFDLNNQREISNAIKQFRFAEIIKYLNSDFSQKKETKSIADFFAKTLPEYSHVSTFTHGGAYATNLMRNILEKKLVHSEVEKILRIAFAIACISKENVFVSYNIDASFTQFLEKLHSLRRW